MRIMRSMIFGCLAMLAAAFCMSAPAAALDFSPAVYSVHSVNYDYDVPAVFNFEAIVVNINALPARSTNSHAVQYTSNNQPGSKYRNAVDAYFRINPHIRVA